MNREEKEAHDEAVKKATEANTSRNSERLKLLEAIADNAERPEDMDDAETKEAAAAKEDEEAERYARALQEEGAQKTEEPEEDGDSKVTNGETYYRQVINGKEAWQTLKQIRESAQKVDSADEYLKLASESVRNASRQVPSQKDEPVSLEEDETQKLLAAAVLGDEEATKKLASAIARLSRQTRDVLPQIDQRLSFRTELAQLESEYSDVLKDPDAGDLFRARLARLREEAPTTTLAEAYKQIGEPIRTRFKTANSLQDKLERKRTLPRPLNAATRAGTAVEEEEPEDVSADIAKLAAARGKTPYVHGR